MAQRLPSTCGQLTGWLDSQSDADHLRATDGPFAGDVPAAVATATHWLRHAAGLAEQLRPAFGNAQVAIWGLLTPAMTRPEEQ
jgi:hypothetical protein